MCKYCGNNDDDVPCEVFEARAIVLTNKFIKLINKQECKEILYEQDTGE